MKAQAEAIRTICAALSGRGASEASDIARREYPFIPMPPAVTRKYTEAQALRIFVRDGFVDRYSGDFLLFPPVLRVLTALLPDDFPFHRNWKMEETHQAYWELFPTLDHIVPVARGGRDDEENLVSTSMIRNSAKSNSTLEELGWSLHPPGDVTQWDGMLGWCTEFIAMNDRLLKDNYIARWRRAALAYRRTRRPQQMKP
ncbi:MAG: HNH endonuclease [Deltaproteobacteria bacterium]|nr:HNH endonuclease [Deltaproteobacteria bacterium]